MPSFSDFYGLSSSIDSLLDAFSTHTPPHALLIVGNEGVGKCTLAKLLCQAVLCKALHAPCNKCGPCLRVLTGQNRNLIHVSPSGASIRIDAIRDMLDILGLYSIENSDRTVLIENADRMTPQAQNALLKSLEEPSPGTYFVLTAERRTALLPTILSRAALYYLPPWPNDKLLQTLLAGDAQSNEAQAAIKGAGGSIGKAMALLNNPEIARLHQLSDQAVQVLLSNGDPVSLSQEMRNERENAQLLFTLIEEKLPKQANLKQLGSALEKVARARELMQSNVSWQSAIDTILFSLLEDISLG
ncbi:MAG: AAA family ATPase [Christensenellales bacterium]|nr:AAA family ATPase [Clostridiales bacterium]